jgi:hypothetical protein
MKKHIFLLAVAATGLFRAPAAVPEPDNVIYGLITLGTNLVTAAQTNVVISASAQWNGPPIASYQMGWLPSAGNFYSLHIALESLLPVVNPAAALSNQLIYLSVNDGTGVRAQASVTVGGRGQMTRLDLAGANPGQTTIPSDNNPTDNSISINETVAYLLAWRTGAAWPIAPTNIPLSYAVRTGALWRGGGSYELNSTVSGPPAWWVNTSNPNVVENPSLDSAVAIMPLTYLPGQPLTVSTLVTPGSVISAYGAEDQPPPGWTVANINNGGAYDAVNGKVKWGLFFDSTPRTLSYQVTPPTNAIGAASFAGQASYDGVVTLNISGQRVTSYAPTYTFGLAAVGLGHSFHIGLMGSQGQTFLIEASTDLTSWQLISTVVLDATGSDDFYDPVSTNQDRFYRVALQVQ